MKKKILKFRIWLTNISRIVYSFLFINVGNLFSKMTRVDATVLNEVEKKIDWSEPLCYAAPAPDYYIEKNVFVKFFSSPARIFVLLVPIALIVLFVMYIRVKKKKDKKDDNKEEK